MDENPNTNTTDSTRQWEVVLEALATANKRALENGARIASLETTIVAGAILLATYLILTRKGIL